VWGILEDSGGWRGSKDPARILMAYEQCASLQVLFYFELCFALLPLPGMSKD